MVILSIVGLSYTTHKISSLPNKWACNGILQVNLKVYFICVTRLTRRLRLPACLPPPLLVLSRRLTSPPLLLSRPPSGHSSNLLHSSAPLVC